MYFMRMYIYLSIVFAVMICLLFCNFVLGDFYILSTDYKNDYNLNTKFNSLTELRV